MPEGSITTSPLDGGETQPHFDLHETLSFIWRQWKFVVAITLVTVLVGTILLLRQVPLYTATTDVLLDRQHQKAPGGEAIQNDVALDIAALESQMAIIRSTVLLRRVVEKEHLALPALPADTPPPAPSAPTLWGKAMGYVDAVTGFFSTGWFGSAAPEEATPPPPITIGSEAVPANQLRAIAALKAALKVTRQPQGYVLAISVTSPDPNRAARLANAVADAYLVDKLDTRFDAAKRASAWLSDRLLELRKQVREAEEAVADFRAAHGLVRSGNVTLNEQQLSELNAKLIDAKADLAQKKARVDLLAALQARGGQVQNMPELANAGTLPALRQQLATLSAQEADLLARYGAAHPLVVNIRAQLSDVQRSIAGETQRLAAAVRNEYELAQARVASLQQNLQAATGQSNIDDATAVHLRELERTAAVNKTLFEDFLKQAKITQEQSTFEPQEVRVITPALPPHLPSSPRHLRFMIVTVVIGVGLGIAGALAKEKLHAGFTTPKQVEDWLSLPLLASVGRMTRRDQAADGKRVPIYELPFAKPLSRFGEAIRSLRSGIRMTDVDHPPKVVQVTSAVPGEGKTTIALSLAASAAMARLNVLFIDADLRHPSATRIFGLAKAKGLVDLLLGEAELEEVLRYRDKGGYWVLGAGSKTQSPTDLLGSERMKRLIAGFKEAYDVVVVDTPPAGPVVDPVVVSHLCDKTVLVVRWGATARELVRRCVDQLSGHRRIAGIAFNQLNERQAQKYGRHAYSYYYGKRYYKNYYS